MARPIVDTQVTRPIVDIEVARPSAPPDEGVSGGQRLGCGKRLVPCDGTQRNGETDRGSISAVRWLTVTTVRYTCQCLLADWPLTDIHIISQWSLQCRHVTLHMEAYSVITHAIFAVLST